MNSLFDSLTLSVKPASEHELNQKPKKNIRKKWPEHKNSKFCLTPDHLHPGHLPGSLAPPLRRRLPGGEECAVARCRWWNCWERNWRRQFWLKDVESQQLFFFLMVLECFGCFLIEILVLFLCFRSLKSRSNDP